MLLSFSDIECATGGAWLRRPDIASGVSAVVTDSRQDCTGALFIALAGENFDAHDFLDKAVTSGAAALCINRGSAGKIDASWNIPVITVDDTLPAYQKIAGFHKSRLTGLKTIVVTGSMGKTSTKEIIRSILETAYGADAVYASAGNTNNQVGVPQNLLRLTSEHRACVIEMGTNHHGEIEPLSHITCPDVAVVSSIGPCHLEFLGDTDGVAREKSMIFSALHKGGTAVIPVQCAGYEILAKAAENYNIIRFGASDSDADIKVEYLGGSLSGSRIELCDSACRYVVEWPLTGAHQAHNAAAAAAAARAIGVDWQAIVKGLEKCVLPGFRMKITERDGVTWINDAYNASPGSMRAVIEWVSEFAEPEKAVAVLGDMLELGEYSADAHFEVLEHALNRLPEAILITVGIEMEKAANKFGRSDNIISCRNSLEAGERINAFLAPGKIVLLKGSRGMKLELIEPGS